MAIKNQEALNERANNLEVQGLNGFELVLVTLQPDPNPTEAILTVHFHNSNEVHNIFNDFDADSELAKVIFPITGGHRILGGPLANQVQVVNIEEDMTDDTVLRLTIMPIGDYSTYTLSVVYQNIDPIFSDIEFKFRPGCFNLCAPDWKSAPEPKEDPAIDYLSKDYESFRHTMIAAMMERVPGWQPTSEADLDQVLLELFSVAADELSDYQDRVMNEAYLSTARKRLSLARHARLMDYHIHQGNQASTWLALKVNTLYTLDKGFQVGTGNDLNDPSSVVFITRRLQELHPLLNDMSLYTWSDSIPALAADSTSADLKLSIDGQIQAETVKDLIRDEKVTHLLIQEWLNPSTGKIAGTDPTKRQILELLSGEKNREKRAEVIRDPLELDSAKGWFVRVRWEEKDKLKRNYCFTVDCTDGKVENVSLFHGNLVEVYHGRPVTASFKESGTKLTTPDEFHYERTNKEMAICKLLENSLAYKGTLPGGDMPPESTLEVEVEVGSDRDPWDEVISLVHSDDSDEKGDHFVVETDEETQSLIRFGNGINGKKLPEGAIVHCFYQIGRGLDGNVGADSLQKFDKSVFSEILSIWNPFDVISGRDQEPVAEIIRRVPQAYRYHQLRAVTLRDYVDRAEELSEVSMASARYMWTGSWRTVRVTIDPAGTTTLTNELVEKIARHLDAVRLIGEDLEIRPPRFVPLDIEVSLCIHADYWPEDIRFILEQEFSDGFTPDGRMAFFHPDRWTFGQELRTSQIVGSAQTIKGVDHVIEVTLKRWNEVTPGTPDLIEVQPNEIIQVKNDPDHMEEGFIFFDVKGGRQ